MTKAKRCDRCDAVEERDPEFYELKIKFSRIGGDIPTDTHLCEDCQTAFREWFAGDPEGKR